MESDAEHKNVELAGFCLTVSQLNRIVAGTLQRTLGPQRVRGEIASLTRAVSGHWYFSLKDASAQVRCVMFRSRNALLDFMPRDGDEVEVFAAAGLYEARGEFQLTVETLRRFGAGRLWEEFLRLRQRLAAEGLFDTQAKRPLPGVPRRVGVVTSLQAAALRDVLTTLRRRAPYLGIIVYPVPVQGAEAAGRIVAMLATASARAEVDVLLLVRGGGSLEDLWSFNDERVARAIRASALPVIVGVGHESDFTIADLAADVRAPTPTAAAEFVAPERGALLREVGVRMRAMARAGARVLGERAQRIDHALRVLGSPRAPLRALRARVEDLRARCARQARVQGQRRAADADALARSLERHRLDVVALRTRVDEAMRRLQGAHARAMQERANHLGHLGRALAHLNVQGVLDRGFAIVRDEGGRLLTDAAQLSVGARVHATFARAAADLRVETVKPHEL
jgi:exodeoxyribonuclease VII large subunit